MTNKSPLVPVAAPRRRGRPARAAAPLSREELVQRAFSAFAAQGYEAVTLRQLAADCGVSDSLLSHHFGSKQQLWIEAADSVFAPLLAELLAMLEGLAAGQDLVAALRCSLQEALRLMARQPEAVAFMFREGEGDDARGRYLRQHYVQPYTERIDVLFAEAQTQGYLRRVTPVARHALVLGLMRMIAIPGVLKESIAQCRCDPAAMAAVIDDVVVILFDGQLQEASPVPVAGPVPI